MNPFIYIFFAVTTFVNILVPISGSAVVTPAIAFLTDPQTAIGLTSFYFVLSGIIRISFFRKNIRWDLVKKMLPISSLGAIFGALALIQIPTVVVGIILLCTNLFFIIKKIQKVRGEEKDRQPSKYGAQAIGLFSGFLQGTGLAGSDLRNNFLYSKGLAIVEVHGTTASVGATNFLLATIVRLSLGKISLPELTPLLYVFPFILLGTWLGRIVAYKIPKKIENWIVLGVMCCALVLLLLSFYS